MRESRISPPWKQISGPWILSRFAYGSQKVGVPNRFDQRRTDAGPLYQTVHPSICPLHSHIRANGNNGILHTVEQSLQFTLAGLKSCKTFFQAAAGLVERGRHVPDFVRGRLRNASSKVSSRNVVCKLHDPL